MTVILHHIQLDRHILLDRQMYVKITKVFRIRRGVFSVASNWKVPERILQTCVLCTPDNIWQVLSLVTGSVRSPLTSADYSYETQVSI